MLMHNLRAVNYELLIDLQTNEGNMIVFGAVLQNPSSKISRTGKKVISIKFNSFDPRRFFDLCLVACLSSSPILPMVMCWWKYEKFSGERWTILLRNVSKLKFSVVYFNRESYQRMVNKLIMKSVNLSLKIALSLFNMFSVTIYKVFPTLKPFFIEIFDLNAPSASFGNKIMLSTQFILGVRL